MGRWVLWAPGKDVEPHRLFHGLIPLFFCFTTLGSLIPPVALVSLLWGLLETHPPHTSPHDNSRTDSFTHTPRCFPSCRFFASIWSLENLACFVYIGKEEYWSFT